jgi:hypothetical protein
MRAEPLVPSPKLKGQPVVHVSLGRFTLFDSSFLAVWLEPWCQATWPGINLHPRSPKSNAWDCCLAQANFVSSNPNRSKFGGAPAPPAALPLEQEELHQMATRGEALLRVWRSRSPFCVRRRSHDLQLQLRRRSPQMRSRAKHTLSCVLVT